jgi:hypothetical protein
VYAVTRAKFEVCGKLVSTLVTSAAPPCMIAIETFQTPKDQREKSLAPLINIGF